MQVEVVMRQQRKGKETRRTRTIDLKKKNRIKKADFNTLRAVRHGLLGRYSKVKRNARDLVVLKGTVSKAQQQSVPVQRKDSEHGLKPIWLH